MGGMENPGLTSRPSKYPFAGRVLGWVALGLLVMASIHLAGTRMLQVDEAQQVYQAGILARGETERFYTHAPLLHLGPMSWIARHAGTSKTIFMLNRLLFLGILWANVALLARLCAGTWRGVPFLAWLLGAATLVPMWDYGFEIRHDNVMLTGLLVLWGLGRAWRVRPWLAYGAMGAVSVGLQFCAFKSFLYWVPLCAVFLLLPPDPRVKSRNGRLRAALSLIIGAVLAFLAVRIAFGLAGGWQAHVAGFMGGLSVTAKVDRFSPIGALERLLLQTPLLLALALAAVLACGKAWKVSGRKVIAWEGPLPEVGLMGLALLAFLANPTPFPYNLVFLVPFLVLCVGAFWRQGGGFPTGPLLTGLLVFGHGFPFIVHTIRHWDHPMDRQVQLQAIAEALTDPIKDRVYDGIGLVPTRASIGYDWWLHTFTIQSFYNGGRPSVSKMLEANPASVILSSYRTDWLPPKDQEFIHAHYLPLADDCLVLGGVIPAGGGAWECLQPGRYEVRARIAGEARVKVDGQALPSPSVVVLDRGRHQVECIEPSQVVWLGPRLSAVPFLPPGNHKTLFVNWY